MRCIEFTIEGGRKVIKEKSKEKELEFSDVVKKI